MPAKRRHGGELVAQSTNLYEILQVPKNASQREIVQAYHQRALKLHPDKQGGDKDMFQKLAQAYEVLVNPTTRDQYHMSLLHHRSNDGLVVNAKADIPNMQAVHPLADFPDEMIQLLLVVPLQGWQRLLRGFRVDQLDALVKALATLTKCGRKPNTRKQEGASPVGDLQDMHLTHLCYRSSQGTFQANLTLHGFQIYTPYTKLEPVAAFYHTAIVELKEQVIRCSQGNQDFDAAMKEALVKVTSLGFDCPFTFRFMRMVGGKWILTPQVADLGVALAIRQEAQELQDSKPSTIKRLTDKWKRAAQKSSEAHQTLRQRKAVELKGYIMALQDSLRLPTGPIVRLRRDGKQPPDIGLKVLLLGRLAANLQLETADLELQLASPAGQRVLQSFFEQNQSNRTSSLPLDCPCSTFGSLDENQKRAVLRFLGLVDLARLGATCKQSRQDVQTSLHKRCTDGLELTPRDFSEDEMRQISQVIGFLHQRFLAEVIAISFSEELPASVMSHGLLWATLSAMSNLKVVFLHRVHALCPPADAARKFAVQVGL